MKANKILCMIALIIVSLISHFSLYSQSNCTSSGKDCEGAGDCKEQKTLYDAEGKDTKNYAYCRKVQRDPSEGGDTCACAAITKGVKGCDENTKGQTVSCTKVKNCCPIYFKDKGGKTKITGECILLDFKNEKGKTINKACNCVYYY